MQAEGLADRLGVARKPPLPNFFTAEADLGPIEEAVDENPLERPALRAELVEQNM